MERPTKRVRQLGQLGVRRQVYRGTARVRRLRPAALQVEAPRAARVGELKNIDVVTGETEVTTTGAFYLLNGCVQGAAATNRIGRKINMKSLQVHGQLKTDSTTTFDRMKVAIIYDRQANAANPTAALVFTADTPFSMQNLDNSDRFVILKRFDCDMVGTAAATTAPTDKSIYTIDFFIPLNELVTKFDTSNAGDITDITSGSLFLYAVGMNPTGTAAGSITFTSRVRFHDA